MTTPSTPNRPRRLGTQLRTFATTRLGLTVLALFTVLFVTMAWVCWPYLVSMGDIRAGLEHQPSRLWGVGESVAVGHPADAGDVARRLQGMGFRRVDPAPAAEGGDDGDDEDRGAARPRTFSASGDTLTVHLPHRATPDGRRNRETRRRCPAIQEVSRPGQEPEKLCDVHRVRRLEGLWQQLEDVFGSP